MEASNINNNNNDQDEHQPLAPVVFKSFYELPNCEKPAPDAVFECKHFHLNYFKPGKTGSTGHYELASVANPFDAVIKLYSSGLRTVVNNLETAFKAAESLQNNIDKVDPNDVYTVCQLNNNNGLSTRLVLSVYRGKATVCLRLYTSNEQNEVYPTRRVIQFDPEDDIAGMNAFIKGKK